MILKRNSVRAVSGSRGIHRVAAAVAVALASVPALAAEQEQLDEVVITAERRSTNLQDTPLSIQAITAEVMEQKGLADLADVALYTPNLSISGSRGSGNNQPTFAIRGISGGGGATSERGVALYIDDIFVPRTSGSIFKMLDLERVEVLRGPQGTLFGRNSEGGAVRLITKQPTHAFEAYLKADVGNFSHRDFIGMLNMPIGDNMAFRIQAAHLEENGYVKRGPERLGGSEDWIGRAQLAIDLNDDVKLTLSGLYTYSWSGGSPNIMKNWDMSPGINNDGVAASAAIQGNYADWISDWLQASGQPRLAIVNDDRLVKGDYTAPGFCFLDDGNPDWDAACAQKNNNRYYQGDARLAWKLGADTTASFSLGFARLDHSGITDWQYLGTENRPDIVHSKVLNAEALLNSALFGGKVDVVTGLNLFQEKSDTDASNHTVRGTSVFNATTGGSANSNAWAGVYTVASQAVAQKTQSAGLFGSATWHMTDKFNFTGGLRLSYDKKNIDYLRRGGSGPAPTFPGQSAANDFVPSYAGANGATSIAVHGDDHWSVLDWRGTLDYHFTDDIMGYATVSKAFKDGQFSYTVVANLSPDAQSSIIRPIDPEKVINYEAGLRTTWLDGRLRFNPTGYYMVWSNRQSSQQQACAAGDPSCPTGFRIVILNTGNVDVWGVEADAQFALTDHLTLDGSMGTTRYKLNPVLNSGPYMFPEQPELSYNLGMNYKWTEEKWGDFVFALNYAQRSGQQTYPGSLTYPVNTVDSAYRLPAYGVWNARLQVTTPGGKNVISVYANNLADRAYATYATRFGGGFWDSGNPAGRAAPTRSALQWVMGRPREVGITLQHNF
ncbi:MAG: TonB-dependent receptor [Steroidobacteraceae bacterium]